MSEPTVVPDDAYAIIVESDGQILGVYPEYMENEPATPEHILMVGIIMHMRDPEWAQEMINVTVDALEAKRG